MKSKRKVLHLQLMGGPGGIVSLCRSINEYSSNDEYFYFIFDGGIFADKIAEEGGRVIVKHDKHFDIREGLREFIKFCTDEKIDLLIAHANSPIVWLYAIAAKKKNHELRLKTYVHADPTDFLGKGVKKIINKWIFTWCCSNSEEIIAISKYIKKRIIQTIRVDKNKVIILYNGISVSKFKNVVRTRRSHALEMIYVGRITERKNVIILPEVVDKLVGDFHMYIVGDGDQLPLLKKKIADLNLNSKIECLGNRMDIPELLSNANLFVHPAIWEEGFGITLVESMASGVPCVAFNKGAIPEIIDDNYNGWIVKKDTIEELTKKIQQIYNEYLNDNLEEYSKRAKEKGCTFDMNTLVQKLENF